MIDTELRTYLLADAQLTTLLNGGSIYPQRLPQGVSKPCIVYDMDGGMARVNLGSVSPIQSYNCTLKVYSTDYGTSRQIAERLLTLMTGLSTTLTSMKVVSSDVNNVFTDYEDDHELYSSIIDISINTRN